MDINRGLRMVGIRRSVKQRIDQAIEKEHNSRWENLSSCTASNTFWQTVNRNRSGTFIKNNRGTLRNSIAIFIGHNLLRKHAKRINLIESDEYRYCEGVDNTESIFHILTECEATGIIRFEYLGDYNSLQELENAQLLKFLNIIMCCPLTIG